ncbi:MAG: malto-oligosyltrehalose synthase [Candidatus Ancillula sp.]|jgi:malto-oligosyltrehalose synthase/malto-oligosyltrehalose trehalohydrolase|nr:malto-oligosyltrehalose synthase [Candidatus Ancillula sp.]
MSLKAIVPANRCLNPGNDIPVSTYRLQLSGSFTFKDAQNIVPYLSRLGITHLYLSPILQAIPGSLHGYDVIDHTRISSELGGLEGLESLAEIAHEHKMGIIIDIVPNHMAIPSPAWYNHQLWDVLYRGRESCYAHWFDIDWVNKEKIVLPVLKKHISDVVEQGEFKVKHMYIPKNAYDPNTRIDELFVLEYEELAFPLVPGTHELPIEELLEKQNYRLIFHEAGNEELNYRRFFDIGSLIAIRVENENVFEATHALIFDLIRRGIINGLRIDHIDGLADPATYLSRLQKRTDGVWVVVEKILSSHEKLEEDWKTVGTTGYEAANLIQRVFINSYGQAALYDIFQNNIANSDEIRSLASVNGFLENDGFETENINSVDAIIATSKRQIMRTVLYADVHRLTEFVSSIFRKNPTLRDHTWRAISSCLIEILVALDQYRPYIIPGLEISSTSRFAITSAVLRAKAYISNKHYETLELIRQLLLQEFDENERFLDQVTINRFVTNFGQVSSAVMAKGVEDTAFYRYIVLTSICEVGGNIHDFGITLHAFHNAAKVMQFETPYAMTAGTTHDSKRSEDVRAFLSVLTQNTKAWIETLKMLRKATSKYRSSLVDGNTENLVWQTIIGTWTHDEFTRITSERLEKYLIKAMREAKVYTSWLRTRKRYEGAVLDFAKGAITDQKVIQILDDWFTNQNEFITSAVLSFKAVQLTMPGVADNYQGLESMKLALVDPDNRGEVDFNALDQMLAKIIDANYNPNLPLGTPLNYRIDYSYQPKTLGELKLLVTYVALQLRKDYKEAFVGSESGYTPLPLSTDCALGFARTVRQKPQVITLVTRYSGTLDRENGWIGQTVVLPKLSSGYNLWIDRLTGKTYNPGTNLLIEVFSKYPVAFLEPLRGTTKKNYLELWAPNASSVDAYLPKKRTVDQTQVFDKYSELNAYSRVKFTRINDKPGWWRTKKMIRVNRDYFVCVDNGVKVPDPRSTRQIFGADGFSRMISLDQFRFTDSNWMGLDLLGKSFYELHIGTFTSEGTFDAAIEKLPYLKALGVEVIEIMPVSTFDGDFGWGYDVADLYSIYEQYGGPVKFQKFVNAAHNLSLAVCLDVVYNHLGPVGDYLNHIGPYYTDAHRTPWGPSFNFDQDNCEGVREWILDHAISMFDKFHLDALRLDATHQIHDNSSIHILSELSVLVDAYSKNTTRKIMLIAESDTNDVRTLAPYEQGVEHSGFGIHMQWSDDFHHALYSYLSSETRSYYKDFGTLEILKKALKQGWVYDGQYSKFRGKVFGTKLPDDFDLRRFVICFSNHDQIGNRGLGDRPNFNLPIYKLKIASALTLLSPFTPLIFQGEEWAASSPFQFFANYKNDDVSDACRDGRAEEFKEFGWEEFYKEKFGDDVSIPDPISWETFENCKLKWNEMGDVHHLEMYLWYKQLYEIRRTYLGDLPITSADIRVETTQDADGDTLLLSHQGIIVACNFSSCPKAVGVKLGSKLPKIITSSSPKNVVAISGMLKMATHSVTILKIN